MCLKYPQYLLDLEWRSHASYATTLRTQTAPNLPQVKGAIQIEQANALNYLREPFNSPYFETYNPG